MFQLWINPTDEVKALAQECERDVFCQAFGNTPEQLVDEYGPYDRDSLFLAVTDGEVAAGMARVIVPGASGLKTVKDVGKGPWFLNAEASLASVGLETGVIWDIATLAVRKEYSKRSRHIALALYHGVTRAMDTSGVRSMVSVTDDRSSRLMRAAGIPLQTMPGASSQDYIGSACTPVYCRLRNPDGTLALSTRGEYLLMSGDAITDVMLPDSYEVEVPVAA